MTDRAIDMFAKVRLPPALDERLRDANPWWEGKPGRVLPPYRRWAFGSVLRKLELSSRRFRASGPEHPRSPSRSG